MQIEEFCRKLRVKNLPNPGCGYVWHSTQPAAGLHTAILDQSPLGAYRFALGHDRWRVLTTDKEHQGRLHASDEALEYLDEFAVQIRSMRGPELVQS